MTDKKKVIVNFPNMAKGEPLEVLYLGLFENGTTTELTDEQVTQYEASSRRTFPSSGVILAGVPQGDKQAELKETNEQEFADSTTNDVAEQPTIQIDARVTSPTDEVEGSDK